MRPKVQDNNNNQDFRIPALRVWEAKKDLEPSASINNNLIHA